MHSFFEVEFMHRCERAYEWESDDSHPCNLARISVLPNLLIKLTNPVASRCLQSTGGCWFNWQISSVRASSLVCRSLTCACWLRIVCDEISANSGASSLNSFIWKGKRGLSSTVFEMCDYEQNPITQISIDKKSRCVITEWPQFALLHNPPPSTLL